MTALLEELIEQVRTAAEITGDELLQAAAAALESTSRALSEKEGEVSKLTDLVKFWIEDSKATTCQRDEALAALKASEERETAAVEALEQCEEYFDNRADADCDQDGFIPNKEMRLLSVVRAARSALENGPTPLADATKKDPGTEQREAGV